MSHELYYTSAPEGLKRGSSGFSTVATTDSIPKPLWDRLETLSTYRHHFAVASDATHSNPTSFAHWLLSVTGTTYHVLSRICDSGVDHTQRSNAFAHHLVLDSAEMASAAGGPAWLLQQPGIMQTSWDGTVGPIARKHHIPAGTTSGSICSRWQSLTGDAGWGGVLADLFVKSPTKPVCILFSPEQSDALLPLLAETIALLPPQARWNVTFNTYFTSMPTSATCAWRCCLANTPAAQTGLRYAANGIVLDLTDRARLPDLPPGEYVTYARTGIPTASRTAPTPPAPTPSRPAPAPPKPATILPAISTTPEEEAEEERREFELLDAAHRAAAASTSPSPDTSPTATAQLPRASAPPKPRHRKPAAIVTADRAYLLAQTDAAAAATRRRKQVMLLFAGALAAIALAMVIILLATHTDAPTELPSTPRPHVSINTPTPAPPPSIAPPAPSVSQTPTTPHTDSNTMIVPAPAPASSPSITVTPIAPSPPPVQVVPQFTTNLTLVTPLDAPATPRGLADPLQTLLVPTRHFNASARIASLRLHFPGAASDPPTAPTEYSVQGVTPGKITASPSRRLGLPTLTLTFSAGTDSTDLLDLAFNTPPAPAHPSLDLTWKAAALVKHPDIISLAWWLLQNSTIELVPQQSTDRAQQLHFKPLPIPTFKLSAPTATISLPTNLPLDADVAAPTDLPAGWDASTYIEHTTPNPAHPAAADAPPAHVVKFHKSTAVPSADPLFTIRFTNNFTTIDNGFPTGLAFATTNLDQAESDVRAINTQIADAAAASGGHLPNTDSARLLTKKHNDLVATAKAAKEALDAYREIQTLTIPLTLPDGTHLLAIPLQRDK